MSGEKGSPQEKASLIGQQQPAVQPQYGVPQPGQPPAGYGAPPAAHGAPPEGYGVPPAGYGAPPTGYGAPPAGYGAPPAGYGAPPTAYGAPPTGYAAPPAGYGAPPVGYGAPPAAYAAPSGPPAQGQPYYPTPPPPQQSVQQPVTAAGTYQLPAQQQSVAMQQHPQHEGMWQATATQDGQMGVTVPAPPPYKPPEGPWWNAPMVTVVLPQALSPPPETYHNMGQNWDEYTIRQGNKVIMMFGLCTCFFCLNCLFGPITVFLAWRSNKHMDNKEGKQADKKRKLAMWLFVTWACLMFFFVPMSAIIYAVHNK